ncbi:DNA-directed RNA polymerase subunit [Anaeramoeba ignava]|uniref:DNA-directed RNA polymerase subunit n=1 Tax=Anaeramoeba ignava TaxID=1746090 RepID=A0A9Q0LLP0_ANAIG|nr:DNA-directed RNA polymerase subunit [Anaeramoeba ignava]
MDKNNVPLKKITRVQFGIFSADEIRSMSVAKIEHYEMYENNKPKTGGLADLRLGTSDNIRCETCGGGPNECIGHFGHIDLAKPVYHIGFLPKITKILSCVCNNCGRLLLEYDNPDFIDAIKTLKKQERFRVICKLASTKSLCLYVNDSRENEQNDSGYEYIRDPEVGRELFQEDPQYEDPKNPTGARVWRRRKGCNTSQPKISRKELKIYHGPRKSNDSQARKTLYKPEQVLDILRKITDSDWRAFGIDPKYTRPESMIVTCIPVPPPCVRPSVQADPMRRSQDDITYKLSDILKINRALEEKPKQGAILSEIDEMTNILQYHVATLITNEIPGMDPSIHRSGRPLKAFVQRLKGKEGRIRGNLMGKRVDFSARTVITPDPTIGIDEVGVPRSVALNMTYPEVVTPFNSHELYELVRNGPTQLNGANYIIRDDGTRHDLRFIQRESDLHLAVGYKVERHLRDGDVIVFNRQPSLHKMSMMGHKIRVMPYSTFRLNLSVCLHGNTPINTLFGTIPIRSISAFQNNSQIFSCRETNKSLQIYRSSIVKFHKISPSEFHYKCYEILTESGHCIKCTEEHPFITKNNSRITAKNLTTNDYLIVHNQKLPSVDFESGQKILSQKSIISHLQDFSAQQINNIINDLSRYHLLDIAKDDHRQILLAGLAGYLFRSAQSQTDIQTIQMDLQSLGIAADVQTVSIHYISKLS